MLSGCDTGVSEQRPGDEAVGFIRAMLLSGVRSIVASQWQVSDASTSDLLLSFHESAHDPAIPIAEALRQAARRVRADPRYAHHYHWGSFTLVGSWEVSWMTAVLAGQPWAEFALEIDEDTERDGSVVADEEVRVLARASRLAIRCDPATRHTGDAPGTDVVDFPLHCIAHAHPECRFRWVRVTIDVSGISGASIVDLSPRDEISKHPVKITTTYSGGLKFNIAAIPLQPDLSAERTTEQDIYFPTVSVSGVGFGYAMWDFAATEGAPLKVDRALRMLSAIPASAVEIPAHITVRASVTARGLTGRIPLIGRQTKTIPLTTPV